MLQKKYMKNDDLTEKNTKNDKVLVPLCIRLLLGSETSVRCRHGEVPRVQVQYGHEQASNTNTGSARLL